MELPDHGTIAVLLLLLCGVVFGTGLLLAYLVSRWWLKRPFAPAPAPASPLPAAAQAWDSRPVLYQQPGRWLAIRGADPSAVQAALGLHNPRPCSWEEGLASVREHKLFISPPIAGWTLVLGSELPDPADDVDACFHFLTALSRKLGQVQYFNADRILYDHAWVRAEAGRIVRAYAWAGGTLWNQGALTPAEVSLGLRCLAYGEMAQRNGYGIPDSAVMNVERTPALAARWSINPVGIDERVFARAGGIAGETFRSS